MGNTKVNINKGRKMKVFFCYVGLLVLVILLFLPLTLRLLVKEKDEAKKMVVTILSCEKNDESISSTFADQVPNNILYKIKGDYSKINTADEEESEEVIEADKKDETEVEKDNKTITSVGDNQLLEKIKAFSTISYDEVTDTTSVKLDVNVIKNSTDYELYFGNMNNQEVYFKSLGFSCVKRNP